MKEIISHMENKVNKNIPLMENVALDVKKAFYYYVKYGKDLLADQSSLGAIR